MFQSTRPHGARQRGNNTSVSFKARFNPRARTGRDSVGYAACAESFCFNPRARTGRDTDNFGWSMI